ncbi:hypothetical protein CC86DRAFT_370489 [Ophiobolus disseminans]|uniref:Uncharacterized protein n=1 Tax=Ophiobolus disseminans TaxID=1469910 RepID=A0A6A7A070_9PLEO|nr:hypothetical protein CC86DRAFT_370489 [Ophiobolus disseminans]
MADRHILSVGPASGRGEPVVVEVRQNGSHPLDLRLVGCEGENPYVATVQQCNLTKLTHNFKGSDEDWATVVSHLLLRQPGTSTTAAILNGVHLVYALKDDLRLSFRRDVQGIKVIIGEIVLPRDDDFEFNPFDWAQVSAKAHSETLRQLAQLRSQASGEVGALAKLTAQLDDFITAKTEAESAMLQQVMDLLNEKKRKIRDQGRLLAAARVDTSVATAVQSARRDTKLRRAGGSRQSKRKAVQAAEPESDSDPMETNQVKDEEQDSDAATPDPSDDETDEEEAAAPSLLEKPSETVTSSPVAQAAKAKGEVNSDGNPPPKRELPFGRPATRSKQPAKEPSPRPPVGDDDDTEDEEL